MVHRDGVVKMSHPHDHISHSDEVFPYQGELPAELLRKFDDGNQPQITILQGFIACGKTRSSKEFARLLAKHLRGSKGRTKEVHSFLFDLRRKSIEKLVNNMCKEFKCKVKGWGRDVNVEDAHDFIGAFGKDRDHERVFVIVLDNVDRAPNRERPHILEFVHNIVSETDNIYMVLTSRTHVSFVRDSFNIMVHRMQTMEVDDAKELLKKTSGNPKNLDKHADAIVNLVGRCPLALMIAGHEMNGKHNDLPYRPDELVGVLTNSRSLSLDLENVPEEDRIINRVGEVVETNFHILEKIIVAIDCPELFDTEHLETALAAVSGPPSYEGQIKQTILHVMLRRSLYGMNGEVDGGLHFESAPLLIPVLMETFCQLTRKDDFLKELNRKLAESVDDTSQLMQLIAKELRQAEILLLRNQKGPEVTPEDVRDLRVNVITKAEAFLDSLEVDAERCREFKNTSLQILMEREKASALKKTTQVGIQETCPGKKEQPVIACGSPPRISKEGEGVEPEACVSPATFSEIMLPGLKDISQEVAGAEIGATEAKKCDESEKAKKALRGNLPEEHIGGLKDRGNEMEDTNGVVSSDLVNTKLQKHVAIPDPTCIEVPGKISESDGEKDDLCKPFNKAMSLDLSVLSKFSSLHSNDCKGPSQETQGTYSVLTTLPVSQVLADASTRKLENRNTEMSPKKLPEKEAVESEFNWENGDSDEVGESAEVVNVGKELGVDTHSEGKENQLRGKKPHLQPKAQTGITTATTAAVTITATSVTQTAHPPSLRSHPKDRGNNKRGQGILGPAPSSASFMPSPSHFPADSRGARLPLKNCPMAYKNTFSAPVDRRYGALGNPPVQEQGQVMSPGPLPPYPVQECSYKPPYGGHSVPYNQLGREYNETHHQESHYDSTNDSFTYQFSKNSNKFSQACGPPSLGNISAPTESFGLQGQSYGYHQSSLQNGGSTPRQGIPVQSPTDGLHGAHAPPVQSYGSSPSPSFRPQGPSGRYLHSYRYPDQSHAYNPRSRFQTPVNPDRLPEGYGSSAHTHGLFPSPSLHPRVPPNRFPLAYGHPSYQNHISTPQSRQMQPSSNRYSQVRGPPLPSSESSVSSSFQPQGPPSSYELPGSLRTNGFYVPSGSRNDPPSQFDHRNYGHHQYGQHPGYGPH